jgi:hypothetical protein
MDSAARVSSVFLAIGYWHHRGEGAGFPVLDCMIVTGFMSTLNLKMNIPSISKFGFSIHVH